MSFDCEENKLMEELGKQNLKLATTNINIKYVRQHETRGHRTEFNVKLKVDSEAFEKIIDDGKLNIGLERDRVYERTKIFKYRGCNNLARDCKKPEICLKFHGQHSTINCGSQEKK